MPKFDIEVELIGNDGNAFSIIGSVLAALRRAGASLEERAEFKDDAMGGDYDNLLAVCMEWVHVV